MRGKSCSEKMKEPKMSGAYIRSLVKQLSSSNLKEGEGDGDGISKLFSDKLEPQRKKQVRRRLHTSRPYQERLLNMAEARREIVTALKYHRASMKQACEKQQLESRPEIQPSSLHLSHSQTFPNNYPVSYLDNFSYSFSPYSWPVTPIQETINSILPIQTLGLNLNLQDFDYLDSTTLHSSSIYSFSEELSFVGPPNSEAADSGLHPAMDDKEMAEIRSIGEQYQMEWDDTLNLVNSAWWSKFLKTMEVSPEDKKAEGFLSSPSEETVELPDWMNANENDFCSDDYVQDPALPCKLMGTG